MRKNSLEDKEKEELKDKEKEELEAVTTASVLFICN